MSTSHPFETFVRQSYPAHYRRIQTATSGVRLSLLKGVLGSMAFFGTPVCSTIWGMGLLLQAQSHQLQDSQRPIPFIHYVEPAVAVLMSITLILCVFWGAWSGFAKGRALALQIEQDELKLRGDFLLRELTDRQIELTAQLQDAQLVLKAPRQTSETHDKSLTTDNRHEPHAESINSPTKNALPEQPLL